MSVSRAKAEIPSLELACWQEVVRRERNEPSLTTKLLQRLCFEVYQLRRAWGKLDPLAIQDFEVRFVYGKEAEEVAEKERQAKERNGVSTPEGSKSVWCGFAGVSPI